MPRIPIEMGHTILMSPWSDDATHGNPEEPSCGWGRPARAEIIEPARPTS